VLLSFITIQNSPEMANPIRRGVFIILIIIHLALHWSSGIIFYKRPLLFPYFLVQTSFVVSLVLLSNKTEMVYALIFPMIGEILGLYREQLVLASLFTAGLLGVGALLLVKILGEYAFSAVFMTIPLAAFVITFVLLFLREVDAKQEAQELIKELQAAQKQLIEYADQAERLILIAERERLARELHDTLSQGLTGLVLQLEAALSHLETGKEARAKEIIQLAVNRAREALAESRQAIHGLREKTSTSQDLMMIIKQEIDQFTRVSGIACSLDGQVSPFLHPQTISNLHRLITEALANITHHAQAKHASIRLYETETNQVIEIKDDGIGFDAAQATNNSGHYGLIGMQERARLISAQFQIDTTIGKGTLVKVSIPLEETMA